MAELARVGDLEIQQDLAFQRRSWIFQRIGWGVLTAFIAAALAGLFSSGPASSAVAGEKGGALWVEYERFGRRLASLDLRVHLGPGAAEGDQVQLWLDRSYIEGLQISHITPEPQSVDAGADRLIYTFRVSDRTKETAVTFRAKADALGSLKGRAGVARRAEVSFGQFVYP